MLFKCLVDFAYGMGLDIFIQKFYGKIAIAQMLLSPFARFYASSSDEKDILQALDSMF